jgi:ribosomal protein S27E
MIHYFAAGVAATRKALERECPACHHKQVVARSRRDEEVPCEKCGEPVPPKKQKD